MKLFLCLIGAIVLSGVAVGCDAVRPSDELPNPAVRYSIGSGNGAYEFRLTDGTRCVAYGGGGIDCEWRSKP